MPSSRTELSASQIVRAVLASGTVVFFVVGLVVRNDARWFVAAGTLGLAWWLWNLLLSHVILPFGDWLLGLFTGANVSEPVGDLRPTIDDTIRLLESHVGNRASQQVCVKSAIRLAEIYRTVKKDPEKAEEVVRSMREMFPDAPEWEGFDRAVGLDETHAD